MQDNNNILNQTDLKDTFYIIVTNSYKITKHVQFNTSKQKIISTFLQDFYKKIIQNSKLSQTDITFQIIKTLNIYKEI